MFEVVGDVCAIHMSNKHVVPDALAAKQAQLDMATSLIESHSGQHEQQQAALNRLTAEASAPCTRAHLHECMHAHAHAQVCAHVRHAHAHAHAHAHTHTHTLALWNGANNCHHQAAACWVFTSVVCSCIIRSKQKRIGSRSMLRSSLSLNGRLSRYLKSVSADAACRFWFRTAGEQLEHSMDCLMECSMELSMERPMERQMECSMECDRLFDRMLMWNGHSGTNRMWTNLTKM